MKIIIETIPHKQQRYPTVGDYWIEDNGILQVRISEMNDKYVQAVILHELFELFSVLNKDITIESIDKFDRGFEALREEYPELIGEQEPGDMISAPYHDDHVHATIIEKHFCAHNDINWAEYEKTINNL
jgi:hypothetical protein